MRCGNMDRSLAEHSGVPGTGTQQPTAKARGGKSSQVCWSLGNPNVGAPCVLPTCDTAFSPEEGKSTNTIRASRAGLFWPEFNFRYTIVFP